jgi:hypothetical protein
MKGQWKRSAEEPAKVGMPWFKSLPREKRDSSNFVVKHWECLNTAETSDGIITMALFVRDETTLTLAKPSRHLNWESWNRAGQFLDDVNT